LWEGAAVAVGLGFLITVLTQGPLLYAVPAVVHGEPLGRALKRSAALALRRAPATVLLMTGPVLLVLALEALVIATPKLMRAYSPDIVLWVLLGRLLLTAAAETALVTAATWMWKFGTAAKKKR